MRLRYHIILFLLMSILFQASYIGSVNTLPTSLYPKWFKTLNGYANDISVWLDGTVHICTEEWHDELLSTSYYTQVSPYGLIKNQFKYDSTSIYRLSLAKGRIAVYATNENSYQDYVGVYSWSGRLLWRTEEFGNENVIDVELTKYGNLYVLFERDDDVYLAKYDSRFKKMFEIKIEPVGEPDLGYFWANRIFAGQDDDVYVVIGYWKYYNFYSGTVELQKFSSSGQLKWVKIFSGGEENIAWGQIDISIKNVREYSDRVFVGIEYYNVTLLYYNYNYIWLVTRHASVYALNRNSGLTLWQQDFQKISGLDPNLLFDMDASSSKLFVRYGLSQTGDPIDDRLYLFNFNGVLISEYELNLPVSSYNLYKLCASYYGHLYMFGSNEETYLVYLGKF
ncbi:MAG: hypothetical protein QW134_03480 [Nitrososphaeria archaeon]